MTASIIGAIPSDSEPSSNIEGDKEPKKRGFNETPRYITIEVAVRDKPDCHYSSGKTMLHKKIHTLLLCYESCWNELEYVKNRRESSNFDMYKSQDGRPPDY